MFCSGYYSSNVETLPNLHYIICGDVMKTFGDEVGIMCTCDLLEPFKGYIEKKGVKTIWCDNFFSIAVYVTV